MCAPSDIPDPPERELVWFVDGEEAPFVDASETLRPWLEESVSWNSSQESGPPGDDEGDGDDADAPELIWL